MLVDELVEYRELKQLEQEHGRDSIVELIKLHEAEEIMDTEIATEGILDNLKNKWKKFRAGVRKRAQEKAGKLAAKELERQIKQLSDGTLFGDWWARYIGVHRLEDTIDVKLKELGGVKLKSIVDPKKLKMWLDEIDRVDQWLRGLKQHLSKFTDIEDESERDMAYERWLSSEMKKLKLKLVEPGDYAATSLFVTFGKNLTYKQANLTTVADIKKYMRGWVNHIYELEERSMDFNEISGEFTYLDTPELDYIHELTRETIGAYLYEYSSQTMYDDLDSYLIALVKPTMDTQSWAAYCKEHKIIDK